MNSVFPRSRKPWSVPYFAFLLLAVVFSRGVHAACTVGNLACAANGGRITASPSCNSQAVSNLIDGSSNAWQACGNWFANTFDLAFDPNLNGTTGASGDA
ncbi:MAG: hypothetical protein Q8L93_01715, partial [Rhodocyclaceae bacterium]|nr:hypothetical protein [Rhodocyclaceae bacterium]